MRIQPITANQYQYQTNFQAKKLPQLKIKPRVKSRIFPERKKLTPEQEQSKNYGQAILFALAFCAAAFTKYFIDTFNVKHKAPVTAEVPAAQSEEPTNTNTYQLK